MTLEDKKNHVYRLMRTGLGREESELLAGVTSEEADQLTLDRDYLSRCNIQRLLTERDLLEKLNEIIEDNSIRGQSTEIRWMLEKINPNKWGKSLAITPPPGDGVRETVPDLSSLSAAERDILLGAVAKSLGGA